MKSAPNDSKQNDDMDRHAENDQSRYYHAYNATETKNGVGE